MAGHERISLNSRPVDVPTSSAKALRRFRPLSGVRSLWIDAVCINQDDVRERNAQVSIMHHIYEKSVGSLIWLGDADNVAERAF